MILLKHVRSHYSSVPLLVPSSFRVKAPVGTVTFKALTICPSPSPAFSLSLSLPTACSIQLSGLLVLPGHLRCASASRPLHLPFPHLFQSFVISSVRPLLSDGPLQMVYHLLKITIPTPPHPYSLFPFPAGPFSLITLTIWQTKYFIYFAYSQPPPDGEDVQDFSSLLYRQHQQYFPAHSQHSIKCAE